MLRVSDMKERLTEAAMDLIWENSYQGIRRKPAFKKTWNRSGNSNVWLAIFSGSLKALLRADPGFFLPTL